MKIPFRKRFWLKVQKKYEEHWSEFLCVACDDFEIVWDDPKKRKKIIQLSEIFLKEIGREDAKPENEYWRSKLLFDDGRNIRLNFLIWVIAQKNKSLEQNEPLL